MERPKCFTCPHWNKSAGDNEQSQRDCLFLPPRVSKYVAQVWPVMYGHQSCGQHPDFQKFADRLSYLSG